PPVKRAGAGGVIMGVPALRVRVGQPAEKGGQFAVARRPKHKVPMVRHQTVAKNARRVLRRRLDDNPLEGLVITSLFEQRQPSHASIESVVDVATRGVARMARHDGRLAGASGAVKKKRSASPFSKPFLNPFLNFSKPKLEHSALRDLLTRTIHAYISP